MSTWISHGRIVTAGLLSFCMVATTGCSNGSSPRPRPPVTVKTLTVLTPHNADIQRAFLLGFSDWYQKNHDKNVHVQIDWVIRGTPQCVDYVHDLFTLSTEAKPRPTPDVLFGGGVTDHQVLAEAGWSKPLQLGELLAPLPREIGGYPTYDEKGRWHATAIARFGILYNQQVCDARGIVPPASWSDLADPRFSGWLAIADPSASGTTLQSFALILQEQGWDAGWPTIIRILGNTRALARRSATALDQVYTGESIASFSINYDGQQRVDESEGRLRFVVPAGIATVSPAAVSVLTCAQDPALAEAFVRYNLSEDGQKLWGLRAEHGSVNAPTLYHYPIVPAIYEKFAADLSVEGNPLTGDLGRRVDLQQSRAQLSALEPLLVAASRGENHLLLQKAWEAVVAAGRPAAALAQLIAAPTDEPSALELGRRFRELPEHEAAQLLDEWSQKMRQRYESIPRIVP